MRTIADLHQADLFDPYEPVFSSQAYDVVRNGWQGVFRHTILELMPVDTVGDAYHPSLGRPTKELYSMAGLAFIMQFKSWTAEEAAHAYMFDTGVHYALGLPPAKQSLSSRSVERMLALFRKDDIAAIIHERVVAALIERLEIKVSKQRLDSSHILSDMAVFGRTQLMGVCVQRLLDTVRRLDEAALDALPQALVQRYAVSPGRLFGDTKRDPEIRKQLRQAVAEEMYELEQRFASHTKIASTKAYRDLCSVFRQQCEVIEQKVAVRDKAGAAVIQNPSDLDATYDGYKGPGYQVQVCETCHEDNEVQVITLAIAQTAAQTDTESVPAIVEQLKRSALVPDELLADSAYGSDENVQGCKAEGIELIAPVNCSKFDSEKLHVNDFQIDSQTETVHACPAGHAPITSVFESSEQQTVTRMDGALCANCPLNARCPITGKGNVRTFRHTPGERRRAERRQNDKTPEFHARYRKRAGIEGAFSRLKRCMRLDRLSVRGKPAVSMAILLKIAGWNIRRAARSSKMRAYIQQIMQGRIKEPLLAAERTSWHRFFRLRVDMVTYI